MRFCSAFADLVGLLSSIPTGSIDNVLANRELPSVLSLHFAEPLSDRCPKSAFPLSTSTKLINTTDGTVVYSPSMRDNSLSITASGQPIHYIQNATGTFVRSRNSVVQILIPDVPITYVFHLLVDHVLINVSIAQEWRGSCSQRDSSRYECGSCSSSICVSFFSFLTKRS